MQELLASNENLCEGYAPDDWHPTISMGLYDPSAVCEVHARTGGGNCNTWCAAHGGRVCLHAQDQLGSSCDLDDNHDRQSTDNNGCDQNWGNQICGCGPQPPAPAPPAIDEVDGVAHMQFNGEDWYLVRRDHSVDGGWHPANDNLAGEAAYGEPSSDPNSDTTWSVPFGTDFTAFLLASGDMSMWVTMTKAELNAQCAASCANCVMDITGSSGEAQPRQYCRTGNPEDPWISAGHHPNQNVYGENSNTWHLGGDGSVDALQAGGSNVWINARRPMPSAMTSRQFNGNGDFISTPSWGSNLLIVTIESWVLFASTSGNHPIMNDDNWSQGDIHYQIYSSQYGFDVNGNGDRTFAWQPTAGEWNLLSVVYSVTDNYIKLFVNNDLQETLSGQAGQNVNFDNPRIGGWLAGSNQARSLDGQIANFRVWSVETSGADSCTSDIASADGLLAAYEFSDSDEAIPDLGPNGFHATASGAAVVVANVCSAGNVCKVACAAPPATCRQVSTANNQQYDVVIGDDDFLGDDKAIAFTVQAGNDAHVGFFSDTQSTGEVYEIVLSGWGNTRSTIRQSNQGTNNNDAGESCQGTSGTVCTPDLLSATEARPFWADAVNGLVRVGTGTTVGSDLIMSWQDPDHHVASYVGFMTGWGATGTWNVCPAAAAGELTSQPTFTESVGDCRTTAGTHGHYETLGGQPDVNACIAYCIGDIQCHAFDTNYPFAGTCWLFHDGPGDHTGEGTTTSRCYVQD
eukprot:SAG22_NODE_167_length_16764_cov_34.845245_5_plen_742_part_00